jgi:hypothetical protein
MPCGASSSWEPHISEGARRRGYSAGRLIKRLLIIENRFQRKIGIEMIGCKPVAIEER